MLRVRLACRSVVFVLLLVCGCGGPAAPDGPRPVAAAGEVLLGGTPLVGATVTFIAVDGRVSCRGSTDERGEFALSTYEPNDGAPPGQYKVVVSIDEFDVTPEGKPVPKPKKRTGPPVPGQYSRPADTPLSAEVTPAGPNRFRFSLR